MRRIQTLLLATTLITAVALTGCEGDAGPAGPRGPVGPPGPSVLLGYANINAAAAGFAVRDFGGGSTTDVTVSRLGVGIYNVTFTGTYTGVTATSDITVLATINDTNNYNVASASMDQGSANATTIVVRVFVWSTTTTPNPYEDEDFSVVVLQ